jgi:mannose/fructose/N-acetylgalactosamine-specific phosphotransferase system component IIB
LADGLALPGWRVDSEPRLIVLVVDDTQPDEGMLALAATAVSQNMQLAIVQPPEAADWAEVAAAGNGRVLLLPETPSPGAVGGSIFTLITEAITAITETAP